MRQPHITNQTHFFWFSQSAKNIRHDSNHKINSYIYIYISENCRSNTYARGSASKELMKSPKLHSKFIEFEVFALYFCSMENTIEWGSSIRRMYWISNSQHIFSLSFPTQYAQHTPQSSTNKESHTFHKCVEHFRWQITRINLFRLFIQWSQFQVINFSFLAWRFVQNDQIQMNWIPWSSVENWSFEIVLLFSICSWSRLVESQNRLSHAAPKKYANLDLLGDVF